jgi:uncharacterized protein YkwD
MLRRLISQSLFLGLFALSVSTAYANDSNLTASPTVFVPMVLSPGESKTTLNSFEQQVFDLVNQERASAGCPAVTIDTSLMMTSSNHSEDMATNNFFDHTGSDGSSVAQRATAAGYAWSRVGENIAAGHSSPSEVMDGWMNSPGHRANILNCEYRNVGIGYVYKSGSTYGHYWTQDFGAP